MSSVTSSQMSTSSSTVSFRGDDMAGLEASLDEVFMELQNHLNNTHSAIRQVCMNEQQDAEYTVVCDLCFEIDTNIDEMNGLFKELKGVLKQVSKPQDDTEKAYMKQCVEKYKRLKAEAVAAKKAEADLAKSQVAEEKKSN